jgi:hypothetical protein
MPFSGLGTRPGNRYLSGMAISIRKTQFDGLDAVELLTAKAKMIVVTGMGPRIAWFGLHNPKARRAADREGRNLLYWDYPRKYKRNQWHLMGGHRVWATRPLADEGEETYAADNLPCTVRINARGVEIQGGIHPVYRTRMSLGIKAASDDTFDIRNGITNASELIWSGGVWSLTSTLPKFNTTYGIPLGRGDAPWDIFVIGYPKRWGAAERTRMNDPAVRLTEDCLILRPHKHVSKRMALAPQGVMGMTDPGEKITFIKRSPFEEGADYPLGCNISFYSGRKRFMVEMEHTIPDRTVLPGASIFSTETWMLRKPVDWARLKGRLELD